MADETTTNTDIPEGVTMSDAGDNQAQTQTAETGQTQQEEQLLAGKFKDAGELEKAYVELQKKLGQGGGEDTTASSEGDDTVGGTEGDDTVAGGENDDTTEGNDDDAEASPYGAAVDNALKDADVSLEDAKAAFNEHGDLTEEQYASFEKAGFPREMVQSYLTGVRAAQQTSEGVTQSQIDTIKGEAGGDEGFAKLQQHIGNSYTEAELQAYNEAVSSGDISKATEAVKGAVARMNQELGTEGQMVSGGKSAPAQQGYASEAEVMADMKKPEYKTDPAFRSKVEKKLAASPGVFGGR